MRQPSPLLFLLVAALEVTLIWTVSHQPGADLGPHLPGPSGNLLHIPAGAALAALLLRGLGPRASWFGAEAWPGLGHPRARLALGLVLIHALTNEVHQFHVPGRACSFGDLFLDLSGALAALLFPWRSAPGRPRQIWPALVVLAFGVAVGIATASMNVPGDDLLARLLRALGCVERV